MKIFLDGGDIYAMHANREMVDGFTTNPSLLLRSKNTNYGNFGKAVAAEIPEKPISFEVIADDIPTMEQQARRIAEWGDNVYVKIPVMQTNGDWKPCCDLIHTLSHDGIAVNVTAVMTVAQVEHVAEALRGGYPSILSVFAGRIADTGRDPTVIMNTARAHLYANVPNCELLWASTREVFNIRQAENCADIITIPLEILRKVRGLSGKDLREYSLETVKQFHEDGKGLTL